MSTESSRPPLSFWLARKNRPEELGTVVVGGGVVGLATAYWLSKLGEVPWILEAEHLAFGASGRNAGYLLTGTAEPFVRLAGTIGREQALRFWEISRRNRELLRSEVLDAGRVDCEFLPEGSYMASLDEPERLEELEASFEELSQAGFEMEWKNAAQVRAESGCPILGRAIFQRQDGGLDPARFCRGLAALSGAQIRQGSRVRALSPDGDAVRVEGDGFDLRARRVVVALNAFVPTLLPSLAGKVWPVRGQMMATAPAARSLRGVWYIDDGFEYARQLSDGTFLLGGCRREAMEEEVGFMAAPTARIQGALDDYRQRAFPAFAELPVLRRWAGTMAFTEDGLPLVGEVPDVPGAVYAAGFNGHGMSLGFVYGKHLAERALGRPAEPLF